MYLVELDPSDGLVLIGKQYDGCMAIKSFREVVNDPELGRECMTAIAISLDHLSPIRNYAAKDKPGRAMRWVTNNLERWVWNQEKIQVALKDYAELQYDPILEEKTLLEEMQTAKLREIKDWKKGYEFSKIELFSDLDKITKLVDNWSKKHKDKNPLADGPVEGDYVLGRLEERETDQHSFYNKNTKG